MNSRISDFWLLFKKSIVHFRKKDPLLLGAATAFFTTFSLPAIVIILVKIFSLYFFKASNIREGVYTSLSNTIGKSSTDQIYTIAENFRELASNPLYTIGISVFLIFVATTLFYIIQLAINRIWNVDEQPRRGLKFRLQQRGISFLIILIGGVLIMITILTEASLKYLAKEYIIVNKELLQAGDLVISLTLFTAWFGILFYFLTYQKVSFKLAIVGGLFTSVLFLVGKSVLRLLLVSDQASNIFGASAAFAVLLLFIFYTSMIMYFGASFTYILYKHRHPEE